MNDGRRLLDDAVAARRRAGVVSGLRGLARQPARGSAPASATDEVCDLCGIGIPSDHRHLLALSERRILCACEACWALRSGDAEYRPSGMRTVWLAEFDCDQEMWGRFQIPIGLAFFMRSSTSESVLAFYPSPAGATESELDLGAWQELVRRNPELANLDQDAEALVANRLSDPHQYVILPIDQCYALVGLIKSRWEGISGGSALDQAVPAFFEQLRAGVGAAR